MARERRLRGAAPPDTSPAQPDGPGLRVDKWLWFARFFKSRAAASRFCASGRVRVGGRVLGKAHHVVRPGDVLTFSLGPLVHIVRVKAVGERRRPAAAARALYDDLSPAPEPRQTAPSPRRRERGQGRPTKAERRAIARLTARG